MALEIKRIIIAKDGSTTLCIGCYHIQVVGQVLAQESSVFKTRLECKDEKGPASHLVLDADDSVIGAVEVMKMIHSSDWNPYFPNNDKLIECVKFAHKYDFSCLDTLCNLVAGVDELTRQLSTLELASKCKHPYLFRTTLREIAVGNICDDIRPIELTKAENDLLISNSLTRLSRVYNTISTLKIAYDRKVFNSRVLVLTKEQATMLFSLIE
jgi:hypothetical protein